MELIETKLAIVLLDLIGSTKFVQRAGAMKAARLKNESRRDSPRSY
jgi:hypothetical protein